MPTGRQAINSPRPHKQRLIDRIEMVKLIRRGWTQQMIAAKFGITQGSVSAEWKIVLKEMTESRDRDFEALVSQKLNEFAEVKREAWEAWERSKQDCIKVVEERGLNKRVVLCRITTKEGRIPESHYLRIILDCLKHEKDLLGLNAPREIKVSQQINWDLLAGGIPEGPVPMEVEEEIRKALDYSEQPKLVEALEIKSEPLDPGPSP